MATTAPELLPDDDAWSRKLCETVSQDIERNADAMATRLGKRSEYKMVKRGVRPAGNAAEGDGSG